LGAFFMKYCDLHIHSTASDGTFTPEKIARRAKNYRLSGISITDHDTVNAVKEGQVIAERYGLDYIPGLEISTSELEGRMHILGYFIDIENKDLHGLLARLIESREQRVKAIIEKLDALGILCTVEDIERITNGATIGRPHIAEHLVKIGAVDNIWEAFDLYLAAGKPAYVRKWAPSPKEAIEVIHGAGGLAVAAHPGVTDGMMDYIPELVEFGIDGIEAFYPFHKQEDQERARQLAEEYNLVITGGSDCHGTRRGEPLLGVFKVRYECLLKLRERWEE